MRKCKGSCSPGGVRRSVGSPSGRTAGIPRERHRLPRPYSHNPWYKNWGAVTVQRFGCPVGARGVHCMAYRVAESRNEGSGCGSLRLGRHVALREACLKVDPVLQPMTKAQTKCTVLSCEVLTFARIAFQVE